jgi:hypothetical protein
MKPQSSDPGTFATRQQHTQFRERGSGVFFNFGGDHLLIGFPTWPKLKKTPDPVMMAPSVTLRHWL